MKTLTVLFVAFFMIVSCGKSENKDGGSIDKKNVDSTGIFSMSAVPKDQLTSPDQLLGLWETVEYTSNSLFTNAKAETLSEVFNDPIKKQVRAYYTANSLIVAKKCTGTDEQVVYAQVEVAIKVKANGDIAVLSNPNNDDFAEQTVAMNNDKKCQVTIDLPITNRTLVEQYGDFLFEVDPISNGTIKFKTQPTANNSTTLDMNKINN